MAVAPDSRALMPAAACPAGASGGLSESLRLFILSLAIAVALWYFVARAPNPEPERSTVESVRVNVAVVFSGLNNGWTATAEPRVVEVEVGGPVALALRPADVSAYADVAGLEPGLHRIPLRVQIPRGATSVKVDPPLVQVRITSR